MTVKKIGLDGLDSLGIDEFNRLYWNGERIVTEAMIDLPTWVDWAIGLAAVAVVLSYLDLKPRWPWSKNSSKGS